MNDLNNKVREKIRNKVLYEVNDKVRYNVIGKVRIRFSEVMKKLRTRYE